MEDGCFFELRADGKPVERMKSKEYFRSFTEDEVAALNPVGYTDGCCMRDPL